MSPDAMMDWLSARGITFVRADYEESSRRSAEFAAAAERWQLAMPDSLRRERLVEGAARLFSGWEFGTRRSQDLAGLPASIKQLLLEHSLRFHDEDKRQQVRRAFAKGIRR